MSQPPSTRSPGFGLPDAAAMGLFGVLTGAISWIVGQRYLPYFMRWPAFNFWFDGDAPLIARLMTEREFEYPITSHHPLFLLFTYGPRSLLTRAIGVEGFEAVGLLGSLAAAALMALTYLLFRGLDLTRLEATVFTLLFGVSSAAVLWFPVPEFAVYGACTITAAFAAVAWWERGSRVPGLVIVAAAASTLIYTVTNFAAGMLALAARFRLAVAIALAVACVGAGVGGSVLQKRLFPHARSFLLPQGNEKSFMFHPDAGGPLAITRALAVHSVVMPEFDVARQESVRSAGHTTVQRSPLGKGGGLVVAGEVLWLALLAAGLGWVAANRRASRTALAMIAFMLSQLLVHFTYGVETILYALHWGVPLVAIAALGVRHAGRWGRVVLVAAGVAVAVLGTNNIAAFQRAAALLVANDPRFPGRN